jgi:hypothetical protein
MAKTVGDNTKPKRADQAGTLVGVRFQPDQLERIDKFIAAYTRPLTRPEAVRLVADVGMRILTGSDEELKALEAKMRPVKVAQAKSAVQIDIPLGRGQTKRWSNLKPDKKR